MAQDTIIRWGKVTCVDDPHGGGRVQVRTPYDNPVERDEDLPWYIPWLPKFLHIKPKVGELGIVISMAAGEYENCNFYIGPIISQENRLYYEDSDDALKITETGYIGWDPNPRLKKGVKPTLFPADDDIAIEGRKDTGIQLKDDEIRIKAGVKVLTDQGPKNNTETPAFISLKYRPEGDYEKDGYKSTATIVADKINLIGTHTTDPATKEIPVTESKDGKDDLISEYAMKEMINKAHKIPYGDVLIEFLDIFRTAFQKHVHPFPTMAPCNDENMKALTTYDLQGTLSDNVRIN